MSKIFIPHIYGISLNLINDDISEKLIESNQVDRSSHQKAEGKDYDLVIQHYSFDSEKFKFTHNKKIVIQPVDGTLIDKKHINDIIKYDLVLTPSENSKKLLINSGVDSEKVKVVPNYWRKELLDDCGYFDKIFQNKKYTFYTESSGIRRKNIKNIIKHFAKTFSSDDDVRLVVKLSGVDDSTFYQIKEALMDFSIYAGDFTKKIPEIVFINKVISQEELESIMNGIDCYLCLSYMEGFCIPLLNAAVLKKDIITFDSQISGYTDFLDKENAILLPVERIPIDREGESLLIYSRDCEWEEPNYDDYEKALLDCYKKEYKFNKNHDFDKFLKENIMNQYLDIVNKILEEK